MGGLPFKIIKCLFSPADPRSPRAAGVLILSKPATLIPAILFRLVDRIDLLAFRTLGVIRGQYGRDPFLGEQITGDLNAPRMLATAALALGW